MSARPGILAAGVLLWGWQSGALAVAVAVAIVLESPRWTTSRWNLSARDFQRVADFCTWIFVFEGAYFILSKGWPFPILLILQWLPVVLAPLVVAQLYSTAQRIELSALFLSLRAQGAGATAQTRVDLSFPYIVVCVLAAGASNVRTPWYYVALAGLALWSLWGLRTRRFPAALWALLLVSALALGYVGHVGLNQLQGWIFNIAIEYLQLDLARTDPYRATTDIGHIGELKNSQRILLRVDAPRSVRPPILLHRASYNVYASTTWVAREAGFEPLPIAAEENVWRLHDGVSVAHAITISETLRTGSGVLALPEATAWIGGLGTASVRRNRLGAIRVERAPGVVSYTAAVGTETSARDLPTEHDLRVPAQEMPALQRTLDALNLSTLSADRVPQAMLEFFSAHYRYDTYRAERADAVTAISEFLLQSRAGHCEYFATATVLLARAAGIPARYATGFSVQELSDIEERYVVRERHAHAWARLYLEGAWRDVDTTPAQWFAVESREVPAWQPAADLWSWLAFSFDKWRVAGDARETSPWLVVVLIALSVVLLWRLYRGATVSRARRASTSPPIRVEPPGRDSAFYRVENHLAQRGLPRQRSETHAEWLNRVAPNLTNEQVTGLRSLLRLHYRMRFDPHTLDAAEQQMLAGAVSIWLERNYTQEAG